MKYLQLLYCMFMCIIPKLSIAQYQTIKHKEIEAKGAYQHIASGISFPEQIANLTRTNIHALDKRNNNIAIDYEGVMSQAPVLATVYLYPAGDRRDKLEKEYEHSMAEVDMMKRMADVSVTQDSLVYKQDDTTIRGYSIMMNTKRMTSLLNLYECGNWFFKVRISSALDSAATKQLAQSIVEAIVPTKALKSD